MGSVFFGLLSHKSHIGDRSHGFGVQGPVLLAKINCCVVNTRITAIGYYRQCILRIPLRIPHLAGIPDHGRHRSIDNDIAGNVQVGDPLVRVYHGQRRPLLHCLG